ncbi:MAG TPA: alpha/beta fold hydrolase [Candidatus Angelobacter sp.]|jgi:alpha-beta hydrolase superfamily lysophospholipase
MKLLFAAALVLSLIAICTPRANALASEQTAQQIACNGGHYEYLLYAPDSNAAPDSATKKTASAPRAAIMILHGAGDHAVSFIETWKAFAQKENVVILAPELPRKLEFEAVAPAVFRCVVQHASTLVSLDPRQIYLFGHSMGGYLAYDGAMFCSDLFAAVAVHAMGIDPEYDGIVKNATRKIPIKIYIGDRDPLVPLTGVRRTRDMLLHAGFPVEYKELPGHDHNYYLLADQVNADAWKFFGKHRLG